MDKIYDINKISLKINSILTIASELKQICTFGMKSYEEEVSLGLYSGLEEKFKGNYRKFFNYFDIKSQELIELIQSLNSIICIHEHGFSDLARGCFLYNTKDQDFYEMHSQIIQHILKRQLVYIIPEGDEKSITSQNFGFIKSYREIMYDVSEFYNELASFLKIDNSDFNLLQSNYQINGKNSFEVALNLIDKIDTLDETSSSLISVILLSQALSTIDLTSYKIIDISVFYGIEKWLSKCLSNNTLIKNYVLAFAKDLLKPLFVKY